MAGRRKMQGHLIITNPNDSDSDSGSDIPHPHSISPRGALDSIEPPAPIFSQSCPTTDNLSGSSRSSPAPDTTPPPTPSQTNPPTLLENIVPKGPQFFAQPRDIDSHGIGRAPHHIRRPSNDPAIDPSPTFSISHSYTPVSPTVDHLDHRIIMATEDSAVYHKVNITTSRSGEAIRELIFSALQIPDEEQLGFVLYQDTEVALDDPLSNEQLFDICSRLADRSGSLKFIIQRRSTQVYLRSDRRALPPPPITAPPVPHERQPQLPHIGTSFRPNVRQGNRPSPQSQHDTASSTSDRRNDITPAGDNNTYLSDSGYDPPSHMPRTRVGLLRTSPSQSQLSRLPQPPQPSQRPSVGIKFMPKQSLMMGASSRGLSPMHSSPGGLSNGTSDSSSSQHLLPSAPYIAPLQIDRNNDRSRGSITPTPPSYPQASLSPPNSRDGLSSRDGQGSRDGLGGDGWLVRSGRRGSETAAERERLLEQTERAEARRDRERRDRTRERREKERELTNQMRTEETKRWWEQQGSLYRSNNSSASHSPSDTLSPGELWQGNDRPEVKSRPGTTGTAANRSLKPPPAADRPSTAQPLIRPSNNLPNGYQSRSPASCLTPGTPRPATSSNATSSNSVARSLQPAYPSRHPYPQHGPPAPIPVVSNALPQLESSGQSVPRGQAVPRDWMLNWLGHDGPARTTQMPPMQHRLPLSAGSKSMDNLRNQYFNSGSSSPRTRPPVLQTGAGPRRLPTPSSQRQPPNNFGGPSEFGTPGSVGSSQYTSPTTTLPYHDQRSGPPTSPFGGSSTGQRGTVSSSSGTTTPSDYMSRSGVAPWRTHDDRPRSPSYERSNMGAVGMYRLDTEPRDPRDPRPPYVTPPAVRAENVVRGDHAGSFGQAAQNLSPGLGVSSKGASTEASDRKTPPTLAPPLERESAGAAADSTLQQHEHRWIVDLLEGNGQLGSEEATVMPPVPPNKVSSLPSSSTASTSTASMSIATTSTAVSPTDDGEYEDDDTDSESDGATLWQPWKPGERKRSSKRVSKMGLYPIQTSAPPIPPIPPIPPPLPPSRGGMNSRQQLSPGGNVNRHSSFTKQDSITWAFRPPPEDMYERLEEFFPDHDLDKPVIDATPSGGSSPTQADHPPPPAFPPPNRTRHKKSIRVVAHERASKIGSTAQNILRKRSTKLWGSRVEEVTPAQAKGIILSATPDSPPGVPNPKPIFKWVKGDLIGKGTYGRVYLALNATTGEMIAVKQVELPKTASDQNDGRQLQVVEALVSESDTLKDLDHPNIVQYLGFEQSVDHLSIFLEYVPGGSIGGCLRKHGKFDHEVVRSFTSQMLSGLEYLHLRGVLHRDLKADNILLDTSGVCKISDFGISKRSDGIYDNNTGLTAMQGSIFWMAPEMLHNNKQGYNAKIDIWSLGCVVLEMWAGRRPWNQEDIVAVMFKLGAEKEAPPVPEDVELDAIEDDFRSQCFAVNPNERPTAAELRKHRFLELKPGWSFTGFT